MPDLREHVALVTGGARRLGRAIAEALLEDGARVAVHYRSSADAAREVAAAAPDRVQLFVADLTDPQAAAALPRQVAQSMGRLDLLVNSAAVMVRQPFGSVTAEDWDRVQNLNLRAPFLVTQAAAPFLRERRGVVINIADASAADPWPSYLPHSVSKAGVQMLTRGLAVLLAPEVRVNSIIPGAVLPPDTLDEAARERLASRVPLARLGSPADVVAAVRFLLDTQYATGSTVVVDGGAGVRPRVWGDDTA